MGEKNCCTCRVGKYKRALCDESFCEKYHGDGEAEDFIKMVTQGLKTGHWVYRPEWSKYGDVWSCSECGEKISQSVMGEPRFKYCPMCGAKMAERREDETD